MAVIPIIIKHCVTRWIFKLLPLITLLSIAAARPTLFQSTGPGSPGKTLTAPLVGFVIHTTLPGSITVTPTSVLSMTASAAFTLCSPLVHTPLDQLPKIISDPYHPPPRGSDERHEGIDFAYFRRYGRLSIRGEGIQAVLPGRVASTVLDKFPYGNMVMVETPRSVLPPEWAVRLKILPGQSLYIVYAHMESSPLVTLDESIKTCQLLGQVGNTGNAAVAHLHLETRIGPAGASFPSMGYYNPKITSQERALYRLWRTSGTYHHFDPLDVFKLALSN